MTHYKILLITICLLFLGAGCSEPVEEVLGTQLSIESDKIETLEADLAQQLKDTGKYQPIIKESFDSEYESEYDVITYGYSDGEQGYKIILRHYEPYQEISSTTQKLETFYTLVESSVEHNVR